MKDFSLHLAPNAPWIWLLLATPALVLLALWAYRFAIPPLPSLARRAVALADRRQRQRGGGGERRRDQSRRRSARRRARARHAGAHRDRRPCARARPRGRRDRSVDAGAGRRGDAGPGARDVERAG